MTIASAQTIHKLCIRGFHYPEPVSSHYKTGPSQLSTPVHRMIEPFALKTKFNGVSYGLSHCGYDIRVSEDIRMWSQDFLLAASLERFDMPLDWCGIVHDKSTWIRKGLCVHNTVIEPGWCGYLTLELGFHGQGIIDVPKGTGIAQIIFHKLDEPTEMPYEGKYQDQKAGPQEAKFE